MKFEPGDIFFVMHHDNPMSRLFGWFMDCPWSHTGLVLEDTTRRTYTVETGDFAVGLSYLEEYITDPRVSMEVWRKPDLSAQDQTAITLEALRHDDRVYGYLQLLSFAVKLLFKKIGIKIPHFIHAGIVCDQVVLYGLKASSIQYFRDLNPLAYDVSDLYGMIQLQGFEKVYEKVRS